MAAITRGTTPTVTCTVEGVDLTDFTIYLSVGARPNHPWFTADNEQMTLTLDGEDSVLTFALTQEQTLSCTAGEAIIQLRCVKDGSAVATATEPITIEPIIKNGVIVDES